MMKIKQENALRSVDLLELYAALEKKYANVFMEKIGDEVFMYRALGRKEWKQISEAEDCGLPEKEEGICKLCVLHPRGFDFETCDAGIPTRLCGRIIENSLLGDPQSRDRIMHAYRQEMWDIENQITCIINEAFPEFSIEEIEAWDIDRTAKYMSRAEWKLANFKGIAFDTKQTFAGLAEGTEAAKLKEPEIQTPRAAATHRGGKKQKLSLAELKARYPDIRWGEQDDGLMGVQGMEQPNVDTTPPALRENWGFD